MGINESSSKFMQVLGDIDLNVDKVLMKLTFVFDSLGVGNNFCICEEMQKLCQISVEERYKAIIIMDDIKKLNLLSKYISYSRGLDVSLD